MVIAVQLSPFSIGIHLFIPYRSIPHLSFVANKIDLNGFRSIKTRMMIARSGADEHIRARTREKYCRAFDNGSSVVLIVYSGVLFWTELRPFQSGRGFLGDYSAREKSVSYSCSSFFFFILLFLLLSKITLEKCTLKAQGTAQSYSPSETSKVEFL